MASSEGPEVIELDSDDDSVTVTKKNRVKNQEAKKTFSGNCINFNCSSGVDLVLATSFVCTFYGVNAKKKKKRYICTLCLDEALNHQDQLVNSLVNRKPILQCDFPNHLMQVEISDSDNDEEQERSKTEPSALEDVFVSGEDMQNFKEKVDVTLKDVIKKYDIKHQISDAYKAVSTEWDEIDESNKQLDDDISAMMSKLDSLRSCLYDNFQSEIHMKNELIIISEPSVPPQCATTAQCKTNTENIFEIPSISITTVPKFNNAHIAQKVYKNKKKSSYQINQVELSDSTNPEHNINVATKKTSRTLQMAQQQYHQSEAQSYNKVDVHQRRLNVATKKTSRPLQQTNEPPIMKQINFSQRDNMNVVTKETSERIQKPEISKEYLNVVAKKTCTSSSKSLQKIKKPEIVEEVILPPGILDFPLKKESSIAEEILYQTPCDNQPEILEEINRPNRDVDLPPHGILVKTLPKVEDLVFSINDNILKPWIKGKVLEINPNRPYPYRIQLISKKSQNLQNPIRNFTGKQLAHGTPSSVIIPVGSRVVALTSNYYSGIVAESPKSINKYRYLVFFDDGYAQYVQHKHVYLVCESSKHIWDDIPKDSRSFIQKYLQSYPERPMVKLQVDQVVKTEWNGKWWVARVIQIDGSLVQMYFDADKRTEWIYRGSARLGPLYVEFMKANMRQKGLHSSTNAQRRIRRPNKKNLPYVEYTCAQENEAQKTIAKRSQNVQNISQPPTPTKTPVQKNRAVAKKSTARKSFSVNEEQSVSSSSSIDDTSNNKETKSSHSIVYYQTQNRVKTKNYVQHVCGPKCVAGIKRSPTNLRGYSPLSIPLLCGWNRQLCKFGKGKKVILYQAPCGIRLRSMSELHHYLLITKCPMSVDLFDYDYWVHCLAEFVLDKCFINIKDISYGVENVPVPCVNEIDHSFPDTITYTTKRLPAEDVRINLDSGFLCSCDCEDDCQDKQKCQCWQLTIEGATLGGKVPNADIQQVGYIYKRLPEVVSTGIYECNPGCKCSVKTCLNRVVQHPMNMKLQVFKTGPRGWGLRCLNDIPLGSFICIYAGNLLTEQGANEGGKNYGDEYLAELDYVEVVEGIKEGYEEDVLDPELQSDIENHSYNNSSCYQSQKDTGNNNNDSDNDFDVNNKNSNVKSQEPSIDDDSSIRNRLRKRNKGESKDPDSIDVANLPKEKSGVSEDEENIREPSKLDVNVEADSIDGCAPKSVRDYFGKDESVYIMDAKTTGNIGRYLNHSCDPNVFVQNVFVDTHDLRFPWVAFFALNYIRAGQELTWNYNYDVGSIPGKVIICKCNSVNCRGRLL